MDSEASASCELRRARGETEREAGQGQTHAELLVLL